METPPKSSKKKSISQTKTVFRLLRLGELVLPLIPRELERKQLPYLVITNAGEFSVGLGAWWPKGSAQGTALATHEDLACLFSALHFLDAFHSRKSTGYGNVSRWPHDCIDHFAANVASRFPFAINRHTMALLVYNPMKLAGMSTESSKLKRISLGCTVIESNPSMILRVCFFINAFQENKPWDPEATHVVLGGGRRHGALLAWITRCQMTIISVDKSSTAHEEAIRLVAEYRRTTQLNPRLVHVLCNTDKFTAEELKGATSFSRFVGSTRSEQLGMIDKIVYESEFTTVYWNCHVSPPEFQRLLDDFGMVPALARGWQCVTIRNLRQEKTGMTVYLWLRRLPNKLLIRSPQIVKWRHEATQEVDPARAVNNLTADLRPDGAAFGVRRSSRVVASPNTGRISEKLVTSPNQSKIMTPKTKNVKIAKVTPKSASALTPPADRKRISSTGKSQKELKQTPVPVVKVRRTAEGKSEERKEVHVATQRLATTPGKRKPAGQEKMVGKEKIVGTTKAILASTAGGQTSPSPTLADARDHATSPEHSAEEWIRSDEQSKLLARMQALESERESRKIEHNAMLASLQARQAAAATSPPVNPASSAVSADSPAVVPVLLMETLETQAKRINELLSIHKNQTSNPQNVLAVKQMEVIAALNEGNKTAATRKQIKKKAKKEAKKKSKRKALKENEKKQADKARWQAKRAKTDLANAAMQKTQRRSI
jgi:hypothetical protein